VDAMALTTSSGSQQLQQAGDGGGGRPAVSLSHDDDA